MANFNYQVRDQKSSKLIKGKLEAESEKAVIDKLTSMGYVVMKVSKQSAIVDLGSVTIGTGVKTKDVAIFAQQFSTMISAGLSLTRCLKILADQTENKALAEVIRQLQRDVEAGQSLSDAMANHPKVFPPIFINMVKAGETGGVLEEVLIRMADHFESEMALNGKIKSAMTYPVAMGGIVLLILAAMMIFVVPTFQKMFDDMGGTLPLPTQILVSISEGVRGWEGLAFVGGVILLVVAFKAWVATKSGRYIWDSFKLNMPVFGGIIRKMALARFTRTFSTLLSAGVPILNGLDIVSSTAGNAYIAEAVIKAKASIKEGEQIHKPLSANKVFPPMLVQMVAVGEETGALDTVLAKVADFYDEEVSNAVDGITSLIEPLMMATLGLIVGGMVIALYMPMFSIISLVQSQS